MSKSARITQKQVEEYADNLFETFIKDTMKNNNDDEEKTKEDQQTIEDLINLTEYDFRMKYLHIIDVIYQKFGRFIITLYSKNNDKFNVTKWIISQSKKDKMGHLTFFKKIKRDYKDRVYFDNDHETFYYHNDSFRDADESRLTSYIMKKLKSYDYNWDKFISYFNGEDEIMIK